MKISYRPLWITLATKGMTKTDLRLKGNFTTNILANMGKGEHVSLETIIRICETLDCGLADVIELVEDEKK